MGVCITCKSIPCSRSDCADAPSSASTNIKNISAATTTNNNNSSVLNTNQKQIPLTSNEQIMLSEINLARQFPQNYSIKLQTLFPLIKSDSKKHFLIYNDDIKIELKRGASAFSQCIDLLNKRTNSLEPVELVEELAIPFPKDSKLILDKEYISKCIETIKSSTNNRYDIFDFQYDISPNPVLSTMIQVVDDTNSNFQRRNNILNENVKYVGISYGEFKKGIFCFYLLFAY